ncbi:MAG TPA: response regulator transcription factor [Chryseosolibacter sp.]|nr:response regulator transcription factor [Chryseosolibacter sp.]
MDKIKVLIADDHQLVREGVESMLSTVDGIEIIGLAPSGEEAINMVRSNPPDVVLMDIIMPGMNGIEAARWIKEIDESIRVIIVTMEISKDYVSAAIKSGVDGYLPKNIGKDVLAEGIASVYRGERYFNDAIKKLIFEDFYTVEKLKTPKRSLPNQLTKREMEVLALLASGKSNREIAEALFISVKTVETHKAHILIRLGLNNSAELVRYAVKHNIISI